ncbi:alcohol dehydrogenase catalytic domain-containing protein [Streptomyces sp. NPDC097610]|uniref:zinc-dependent alcohol dehydrogenase n=1 Tax=Streptomyces sp. NPDC097610 TaxID=3157227 RepID=UPI0033237311
MVTETLAEPGPGQLLIAPDVVGVCGTDLELYEGHMSYLSTGFTQYPIVPGHEWTGRVVAVGEDVEGFVVGDRVVGECSLGCGRCECCSIGDYHLCPSRAETGIVRQAGGMQERLLFPARAAHRVPANVNAADAALVEPLAVAYRGVKRTGAQAGATVLIVGAGTIGLFCAMLARALDLVPVLLDVDEGKIEFAQALGFEAGLPDDVQSPFVIEASGNPAGRRSAVQRCASGGTVVLLGLSGTTDELDFDDVVLRDVTIKGSLGSPGVWPEVIALLASGRVVPSPVVSHEFDLRRAEDAFELAAAGRPGVRKVVVRLSPEEDPGSRTL